MSDQAGDVRGNRQRVILGFALGFLGVFSFALTLPATRLAVVALDPLFVATGRMVVGALLGAGVLLVRRPGLPSRAELRSLAIIAAGVVFGFPLFTTWALRHVPASHGAVVIGILPLATAVAAALRNGERPSLPFWLISALGSVAVVGFVLGDVSAGGFGLADLSLVGSVISAALAYAEGGRLSRTMGGWQVICWALVLSLPLTLLLFLYSLPPAAGPVPPSAWGGFVYVCLVSQFLGFFAWYEGLALGGVARVGQVQLLQPLITVLASALFLKEAVTFQTWMAALVVIACVAGAGKAKVRRKAAAGSVGGIPVAGEHR